MSTSPKGHKAVFVAILLLTIVAVGLAFTGSVAADTGPQDAAGEMDISPDSSEEIEVGDTITVNANAFEDEIDGEVGAIRPVLFAETIENGADAEDAWSGDERTRLFNTRIAAEDTEIWVDIEEQEIIQPPDDPSETERFLLDVTYEGDSTWTFEVQPGLLSVL